jgi:hypothetical protein
MSEWEYLGLADTTLGNYSNVGAIDLDVKSGDILIAYNSAVRQADPRNSVGIWRMTNQGKNWIRSDSGIPQSISDPFEYNVINSVHRAPQNPAVAFAVCGIAVYYSSNSGFNWQLVSGRRGLLVNQDHLRWHPYRPGEVWFFGETSTFAPYLYAYKDYGMSVKIQVDLNALGWPSDGKMEDVAFDSGDPNVIYVASNRGIMVSRDGGYTWHMGQVTIPDGGSVVAIRENERKPGTLFFGGGNRVYRTFDGGMTVNLLSELPVDWISTICHDARFDRLFVGTDKGVFVINSVDP